MTLLLMIWAEGMIKWTIKIAYFDFFCSIMSKKIITTEKKEVQHPLLTATCY